MFVSRVNSSNEFDRSSYSVPRNFTRQPHPRMTSLHQRISNKNSAGWRPFGKPRVNQCTPNGLGKIPELVFARTKPTHVSLDPNKEMNFDISHKA